jgi:LysR family nitrogen assimilation transcriptional regulator
VNLKRIELCMQVADFGSFSKAATVIGIAQPALGRQIQKLEEECGFRLFYRHGRGISLTQEGETFLERVRPLIRQLELIPSELHAERLSPLGLVTVGLTPTVCNFFGLRFIREMREKYPQLQVNIVSGYSGYVHEWVVNGRLDMAVLHDTRRSSTIAVEPLAIAELFFIQPTVNTTFPLPDEHTLSSISSLPLVLPTKNHGLRRTLEHAASAKGIKLNVQFEVDTLELLKEIVVSGMACTVLARPAVVNEIANGELTAHRMKGIQLNTELVLATATHRPLTQVIRLAEREIKSMMGTFVHEQSDALGLMNHHSGA